jgi:hypothetical protein
MQIALTQLREQGRMDESGPLAGFLERQRVVRKDLYDDLDRRYAY